MEERSEEEEALRLPAISSTAGGRRRDDKAAVFIAPPPLLDQLNLQPRNGNDPSSDQAPVSARPTMVLPPARSPPNNGAGAVIRYRECLKNHAASMGGHVVDGCGEFMPRGEEGTSDALRCAACNCHRNFHRKESDSPPGDPNSYYSCNPNPNSNRRTPLMLPAPPQLHQSVPHPHAAGLPIQPVMVAFGGAPADSSSEDLTAAPQQQEQYAAGAAKKRHRTKFTQEQKDKMLEFAEKLGWRMHRQDEEQVEQFCSEVGVKRNVFKVWMHNNKQAMKKKQ